MRVLPYAEFIVPKDVLTQDSSDVFLHLLHLRFTPVSSEAPEFQYTPRDLYEYALMPLLQYRSSDNQRELPEFVRPQQAGSCSAKGFNMALRNTLSLENYRAFRVQLQTCAVQCSLEFVKARTVDRIWPLVLESVARNIARRDSNAIPPLLLSNWIKQFADMQSRSVSFLASRWFFGDRRPRTLSTSKSEECPATGHVSQEAPSANGYRCA
jgi:hypothetical protein